MSRLRANPYVGLRPFFSEDSLYFFGREQQTSELLEILHEHHFLGVVGSSGSGKSSLVRAGLLPGLLGGFLVGERDHWRIVQIKPGDAPIGNLATGLLEAMSEGGTLEEAAKLEQDIRDGHIDAVIEFLSGRLDSNTNLFLLVDQFEEIFAFRGVDEDEGSVSINPAKRRERARRKAEAADFVDLLISLSAQRELPIYVSLTMRTDFLGDCDLFYGLPEALNQGRYLVPRMTRQQLRDAIECPVILLGASIAPRLLDHVLNELGDRFDRLPVLQHALLRTWDAWLHAGGVGPIELRHFESAGGLERALDQDAESALQGLDFDATARVFKRLTDTDSSQRRVRSPARISELVAVAGADHATVKGIVRRFEEGGRSFVHCSDDGQPDDPRVDISHESLIRQWDRLRNWVDEERQSRDLYVELVERSHKWECEEVPLLWPPELDRVVVWREKVAPTQGWSQRYSTADDDLDKALGYLDESIEERYRYLAKEELQRRWEKIWKPFLLATEVVVGFLLARYFQVFEKVEKFGDAEREKKVWTAIWDTFMSFEFIGVSAFFAGCILLNRLAKRAHQNFAHPRILQGFTDSGSRYLIESHARAAETRDAIDVHDTTYASTGRRFVGYAIDYALFVVMAVLAVAVTEPLDAHLPEGEISDLSTAVWLATCAVIAWLYQALQLSSKRQATLGMRAIGIFRTDLHGARLSFVRASLWWLYRLISYVIYGLGFVSQPFTKRRQTLHDRMARTVVLRRPPDASSGVEPEKRSHIVVRIVGIVFAIFVVLAIIGSFLE